MRVLIADDHAVFRRGLKETIGEAFPKVTFGEAKTADQALLSDREFQVLRMIGSGKAVKDIADELSLSVKTVSTYRSRILEKTGMKTTAELIRFALRSQLVD